MLLGGTLAPTTVSFAPGGWLHGQVICPPASRRHSSGLHTSRAWVSPISSTRQCAMLMHLHAWSQHICREFAELAVQGASS